MARKPHHSKNYGGARKGAGRPRKFNDARYNNKYEQNHWDDKPYRMVYMLSCGYVGSTNNFERRMREHRSYGRNVEGAQIVFASYDKQEALAVERAYHADGYGGNARLNKKK